jgi:hypothetical protein
MIKYGLGCLPDTPDKRDFLLSAFIPLTVKVPSKFSLRDKVTPIRHQKQLGSCVAHGMLVLKEYFDSAEYNKEVNLSEQWLYGECKAVDGYPGDGTYPRVALEVLLKKGTCEEVYMPYEGVYPPTIPPKNGADENAANYKITTYAYVSVDVESIKSALYQNGPTSIAVYVYDSFLQARSNGGFVPKPSGTLRGGHLMAIVGYDDEKTWGGYKGFFEIKNSWGTDFGDNGYLWIPYSLLSALKTSSIWTIVDETAIVKHWSDWPNQELAAQDIVFNKGLIKGYPDGTIRPWDGVLRRHVALIMERLGQKASETDLNDYHYATRGWVKEKFPFLEWIEERWNEPITRFQLILLLARYFASTKS